MTYLPLSKHSDSQHTVLYGVESLSGQRFEARGWMVITDFQARLESEKVRSICTAGNMMILERHLVQNAGQIEII